MKLKQKMVYGACGLVLLAVLAACGGSDVVEQTPSGLVLAKLGSFTHQGGEASAEITAYDAASQKLFVVNGALASLDVLDLSNPAQPTLLQTEAMSSLVCGPMPVQPTVWLCTKAWWLWPCRPWTKLSPVG